MTTDVTTPRPEYNDQLKDVIRNRAAVGGEREVKKATTEFLPPLASMCCTVINDPDNESQQITYSQKITTQGQAKYNKYISNAFFYGASGRTVDGLVGLIFSKPATVELSPQIEYLDDNADGKGTNLRAVAKTACNEAFITPRSGFLVDFPNVNQRFSALNAERMNLRPKILHYKFESIINWHFEVVNNVQKLVLLVLKEPVSIRTGFQIENKYQYRVLELIEGIYAQSVYNDSGALTTEPSPVLVNGNPSDEIPFYFVEVGAEGKSIINDLVDTNLHHYRSSADYGAFLHISSFPIFTETGAAQGANNAVGPGVKWNNPNPEATFGVLQVDGNADSHRLALKDDEERMAALGAEQLKPRVSGVESAEAKSLDQVAQNSTTADVAITVSNELTKAINFCARWRGAAEDIVYMLNIDYNPTGLSPQALTALIAVWQNGGISYETFYENLQKGEIARNGITSDEERALVAENPEDRVE